ncbi:MAG: TrmB family transcriptional regulator sugar-binding domain-containing protein [Nitrososphaerales archaeon]
MSHNSMEGENLEIQMMKIMGMLSKKDVLDIFTSASEGLNSSDRAPATLGMTPRRYYKSLSQLMASGLLKKSGKRYTHSGLGEQVYQQEVRGLQAILTQEHGIELLDEIRKNTGITVDDLSRVTPAVVNDLQSTLQVAELSPLRTIRNYEDLVAVVQEEIDKCKKEIVFATRYQDFRVVQSMLRAVSRGVKVTSLVSDKVDLSHRLQMLGNFFSHPETIKLWHELRASPNLTVKHCNLPYSFAAFEGARCVIEVVNPVESENFFIALIFENESLCENLVKNFNKLWQTAEEDPMQQLLKKPLGEIFASISQYVEKERSEQPTQ